MKSALFGATGMVGSRIAAEATSRGHEVTSLSRSTGGDLADPDVVREAAQAHDVLVSATGPSRTGEPHQPWLDAVSTLIDHAGESRVLFVGGAGSLLTPDGTRTLPRNAWNRRAPSSLAAPRRRRHAGCRPPCYTTAGGRSGSDWRWASSPTPTSTRSSSTPQPCFTTPAS